MSTPSILAAVIAFVACMLAIGAFRRTDSRSRRKIPASSKRSNFLNYNLTMVRGPSQKQWLASAGFFSPDASKIYAAVTIGAVFLGGCLGGIAGRWIEMGTVGVFALAFAGGLRVLAHPRFVDQCALVESIASGRRGIPADAGHA